jgi:signal peptidase I
MLMEDQGKGSIEQSCGLVGEVVRAFGGVRLRVLGTSMVPSILPGDLVSIHRAGLDEISPGEVVLFFKKGRLFVHRVVDRKAETRSDGPGEARLITRGDRLRQDDPPVSSAELLGRVVLIERNNRKVELPACGSNGPIVRLLQASDHLTYLYLRISACWRTSFLRGAKCLA